MPRFVEAGDGLTMLSGRGGAMARGEVRVVGELSPTVAPGVAVNGVTGLVRTGMAGTGSGTAEAGAFGDWANEEGMANAKVQIPRINVFMMPLYLLVY